MCRIAIIDSGIRINHPFFAGINIIDAINLGCQGLATDITDKHGHGTAITGIIYSKAKTSQYVIIKIYDIELETTEDILIRALEYAYERACNLVHLSLGNKYYSDSLECCCKKICDAGTTIVSAYSNEGEISYPAHFSCVIGVQSHEACKKANEFIIPQNDVVDVYAKGGLHRVPWTNPSYTLQQGNSFSAAYLSGIIAQQRWYGIDKREILSKLCQYNSKTKNITDRLEKVNFKQKCINAKVAVFPFNKEIKTLISLDDFLVFSINHIYSASEIGSIGKTVIGSKRKKYVVENINTLRGDEIDWLILGHLNEIEKVGKISKRKILQLCLTNRVNVFSLDEEETERFAPLFQDNGLELYWPHIIKTGYKNGKLYNIAKPVIAIFGTDSRQGKFHAQVYLRELFREDGYKVCQLSTEPIGSLFQMDETIPFGYSGAFKLTGYEFIDYVNSIMHNLELENPDVILVGSQSGTVPECFGHLGHFPIRQLEFLLGTQPDIVTLCVSMRDDIDYIERTIKGIEGVANAQVVALLLFPFIYKNGWSYLNENLSLGDKTELEEKCIQLTNEIGLPTVTLYDMDSMIPIYDVITNLLSEDSQ